ncbi:putative secreted protein [Wickerhamomyces ciferrii]|uniref:Secreted protein n=1 Tax=Wickerhamomyces ciferrii (strain ATCC 14091 / BCRC 22168 / CBS 111 / JCM 3599 / NBRC 0793 / NRRL Y-1031 F-60-10) TaxID=1206466 RepID=K0KIC5_WICCF|nr:uncharacterized protein BN7_2290 [Wickerhamomyces ciferrii]CCH42746.1 putative secreted protein [Wickerhamomyces ciferrii]
MMWIPITVLALVAQTILAHSSYVVQLSNNTSFEDYLKNSIAQTLNIKPSDDNKIEIGDFKAFITSFDDKLVDQLKNHDLVSNVFPNITLGTQGVKLDDIEPVRRYRKVLQKEPEHVSTFSKRDGVTTQQNAPRHLARLSSREGIFNKKSPFEYKYDYTGKGITAYVLDSGVAILNPDFQGRAKHGGNFAFLGINGDFYGHGTNVAGIIGSKTYGVAKEVDIIDVKIAGLLDGGSTESVLKGIEWANNDRKQKGVKAVANLSLGTEKTQVLDEAVNAAYKDGLVMVVAAGNANIDAKDVSPASAQDAITVGALDDKTDTIAIFSNYGPDVDIFASGVAVESLCNILFFPPTQWYGTSQATPVVSGLVAILLEKGVAKEDIKSELIKLATKNAISQETFDHNSNYTQTVNRVVNNGVISLNDKVSNPSTLEQDQSLKKFIG